MAKEGVRVSCEGRLCSTEILKPQTCTLPARAASFLFRTGLVLSKKGRFVRTRLRVLIPKPLTLSLKPKALRNFCSAPAGLRLPAPWV